MIGCYQFKYEWNLKVIGIDVLCKKLGLKILHKTLGHITIENEIKNNLKYINTSVIVQLNIK